MANAPEPTDPVFYLPTLSCRVISHEGLVMPDNLPVFYPDLNDARFASSTRALRLPWRRPYPTRRACKASALQRNLARKKQAPTRFI